MDDQKTDGGTVQKDTNQRKITNWKERSKYRADWEKSSMEAKVLTGL